MCGIIGACGIGIVDRIKKDRIQDALDKIKHRGPDVDNIIIESDIVMGHTRLSIIDINDRSNQPMYNPEKNLILIYNGEIYNYNELKQDLKKKGYKFNTDSDTEVILYAYREWGKDCVKKFVGMWAFALYDLDSKTIFMSRDRIGEKPLYYTTKDGTLFFASEMPALVTLSQIDKKIDMESLLMYFTYNFRHIPWDKSIFLGIKKLPPAHNLIFRKGECDIERYWHPDFTKVNEKKDILLDRFNRILRQAVKRTCVSNVPLGVLLSGGVDSSVITLLLEDHAISSYTIGMDEKDSEVLRAKKVAKRVGINNKVIQFKDKEIIHNGPTILRKLISVYGEPIALLQPMFTDIIMKEVKKDRLKVILAGNGADEILFGYDGTNITLLISKILRVLDGIKIFKILKLSRLVPDRFAIFLKLLELENYERKPQIYREKLSQQINIFNSDLINDIKIEKIVDKMLSVAKICNSKQFIDHFQWMGLTMENEHSITMLADIGGMSQSIEMRSPFLDKDFMQFCFKLPLRYKVRSILNKRGNKWILRYFLQEKLGKDFLYDKKQGFGYNISFGELIKKEWKKDFDNVLEEVKHISLFKNHVINQLYKDHLAGKDQTKMLLGLYIFGIWYEVMMKPTI